MSRIDLFRQHLTEKRAVKVIAGIDNFDIENIKKVVMSAEQSGASAVDICAKPEIISEIREMTDMPIFVSSIVPSELVKAVELGADAIELGNFDVLYKKGSHVMLILKYAKSSNAYYVAEAANKKDGVRIRKAKVSNLKSNGYKVVDMSSYFGSKSASKYKSNFNSGRKD